MRFIAYEQKSPINDHADVWLFDLILYIPVNNFSYVWTGLPGLNQY